MVLVEGFPQQHVFVAIASEPLVEGVLQHQFPPDEQVGSVQVLVGRLLALGGRMPGLLGLLITVAQVALECVGIPADGHTTVDHRVAVADKVAADKVVADQRHVAVDEEHVGLLRLPDEEVSDGGTAHVLLSDDITAVGQGVDDLVLRHRRGIRRAVVGHDDLVVATHRLQLLRQSFHQRHADMIVGRYQNGDFLLPHHFIWNNTAKIRFYFAACRRLTYFKGENYCH